MSKIRALHLTIGVLMFKPYDLRTILQGKLKIFLFLIVAFIRILSASPHSVHTVDSVEVELYLSYNDVLSMAMQGDTLWYGTNGGGVVKGSIFNDTAVQLITSDGLAGNVVHRIVLADSAGSVWAATDNGISYITKDGIESFYDAEGSPLGLVNDIAVEGNRVAGACMRSGTAEFKNGKFVLYPSAPAQFVAYGKDSVLWAGGDYGTYKIEHGVVTRIQLHPEMARNSYTSMAVDTNGHLWLASGLTNHLIAKYDDENWEVYKYDEGEMPHVIFCLRVNPHTGRLVGAGYQGFSELINENWREIISFGDYFWHTYDLVFYDSAQYVYTGGNRPAFRIRGVPNSVFPNKKWLESNDIQLLETDRDGNVWVVPFANDWGIHSYNGTEWRYYSSDNPGILQNYVTGFAQDSNGGYWFGSLHGLSYMHDSYVKRYQTDFSGLQIDGIKDCIVTKDNTFWAVGYGGAVTYVDSQWVLYDTSKGLPYHLTESIIEAEENTIIVGTRKGLAWFINGAFVTDLSEEGPGTRWISSLETLPGGQVVAGTYKGLFIKESGKPWKQILGDDFRCNDMQIDEKGRIWIATSSSGVKIFDSQGEVLFQLTTAEGLHQNYIRGIAFDRNDKAWISTPFGLAAAKIHWSDTETHSINRELRRQPRSLTTTVVYDLLGRRIPNKEIKGAKTRGSGVYIHNEGDVLIKKRVFIR